ncbi:MAG: sn-glycerol-3-phosphate ABC transporter ATP-binding protein UgpC [Candidatus Omnitrophica bacterium]|nr:sn-glycerol-3-phosphate ABC transporter ATP-binding protein UgpC [Candidatus Omnitrophota bacterium]
MAWVKLVNLCKNFDLVVAVKNFSLEVADKEFIVLVGPSGCGKTTILRLIAGLEELNSGEIWIEGKLVNHLPPKDRDVAMVFQNYALYPHMTVFDNIAFGLRVRKLPRLRIEEKVKTTAELLGLGQLLRRKPKELSGGERQRVALARAIVREPKLFLMDEPLSNLDAKLRVQMRAELIKLHRHLGITTIYVTHDQVEAMTMGKRIAVMDNGLLQQVDSPLNLYQYPANQFVAGFIGSPSMNFFLARLEESQGKLAVILREISLPLPPEVSRRLLDRKMKNVILGLRPEHILPANLFPSEAKFPKVPATVDVVEPLGVSTLVYLKVKNLDFLACFDGTVKIKPGDFLEVVFDMRNAHLFDPDTHRSLLANS